MKHIFALITVFTLPALLLAQAKQATLLGRWDDPSIVGSIAYNNRYNEVWSVAVNGHEYAIIGSTKGTHFIDVTNPTQPFEADYIPGKAQGPNIIHRDYKTYKNYIYGVCDEGNSSLQIMDVSTLPDSVRLVSNSSAIIVTTHNIFIDTSRAMLYSLVFGSNQYGYGGMAVLSLANPEQPTFIKKFSNIGGFSFGHIHDAFVRNDTAYLNAGTNGFAVADFSDPSQPKLLGTLTSYPGKGYNHSGWLTTDGQHYYMADETHGSPIKALDVQNLDDIQVLGTFNAEASPTQIPHNAMIACNYLYVSYYYNGLQVFDISDPLNVQRVLYYDTCILPDNTSYEGAWGVNPWLPSGNILISDMQNGLFIFEGIGDNCNAPVSKTNNILKQKLPLQISPQPASEKLVLQLSADTDITNAFAVLMDANMRQVLIQNIDNQDFELKLPASITNGIYFLRVQTMEGVAIKKVLVQR